jgi:hypothetical protein
MKTNTLFKLSILSFFFTLTITGCNKSDKLIQQLKDNDPYIRKMAIQELGNKGKRKAVGPLIGCLKDEDDNVRGLVAEALGKIGDTSAVVPLIESLNDKYSGYKCDVVEALGKIGDKRAVEPLIVCLEDEYPSVRRFAASSLGKIGDPKAIEFLINSWPDWECNFSILAALTRLKWSPRNEKEQVYYWISDRNKTKLVNNWDQVKKILLSDVRSGEKRKLENAVYAFMSLGNNEIIEDLKQILESDGDIAMAETFLNCGNGELETAATKWGKKHGYIITSGNGSDKARWGGW